MNSADTTRWARRPILSTVIRVLAYVGPIALSLGVAWLLTAMAPTPVSTVAAVLRWLSIAVFSSVVLVLADRVGRRLIPIAALLELTLIFPDEAPSRFRVAMRSGSTRQLEQRLDETRHRSGDETHAEAAERIVELVAGLRSHDRVTRGHAERTRAYTQMIADEMGLSDDERDRLRWAGLLHDVGKLYVPASILNKPERLTDAEFDIVKEHPEHGRRIVEPIADWLGESARAVWEHHERWDGTGYPRGLAGTEISLAARIVAVADVYDVLTSARSYQPARTPAEARAEIARCAGTQFDPDVVRAFLGLSLGRVRATAGPLSWLAQLTLFPSAAISSAQAASTAVVLTGAVAASAAGATPPTVQDGLASFTASGLTHIESFAPWHDDDISNDVQIASADDVDVADPAPVSALDGPVDRPIDASTELRVASAAPEGPASGPTSAADDVSDLSGPPQSAAGGAPPASTVPVASDESKYRNDRRVTGRDRAGTARPGNRGNGIAGTSADASAGNSGNGNAGGNGNGNAGTGANASAGNRGNGIAGGSGHAGGNGGAGGSGNGNGGNSGNANTGGHGTAGAGNSGTTAASGGPADAGGRGTAGSGNSSTATDNGNGNAGNSGTAGGNGNAGTSGTATRNANAGTSGTAGGNGNGGGQGSSASGTSGTAGGSGTTSSGDPVSAGDSGAEHASTGGPGQANDQTNDQANAGQPVPPTTVARVTGRP